MQKCPVGHDSADADYCTLCGRRMDGPTVAPAGSADAAPVNADEQSPPGPGDAPPVAGPACPRCGEPGLGQFCESCGHRATPPRWRAVVTASRDHFDKVMADAASAAELRFPDSYPERSFELTPPQMRIGRTSLRRETAPEIDLTGPPADPGVSRLHAILQCQPDGTWSVIDPGSENGTTVNGSEIAFKEEVPLKDGDCIHVGAWTSIAIVAG